MKTKIKSIVIAISFMLCGIVLGACASDVKAETSVSSSLNIYKESRNGQMEIWKLVDNETGVNYIVVAPNWNTKSYAYDGIAITPRLNEDGSLYTSK